MAKQTLPKFKGKFLIEIPEDMPQTDFLRRDFGKAFLEEYQGRVNYDYHDNSVLNILNYGYETVKDSNPYVVVLANQILREEKLKTVTQADLEKILKINVLDLRDIYVDTGLVLRSEDEPNKYLARDLSKQIKKKGYKSTKEPLVIWLNELNLEKDKNSPSGLRFKLSENCEPFYVPILYGDGKFLSNDIDEKTGLPKKISYGIRHLSIGYSGLSRLYSYGENSQLSSGNGDLADSDTGGRVVVVSGEDF